MNVCVGSECVYEYLVDMCPGMLKRVRAEGNGGGGGERGREERGRGRGGGSFEYSNPPRNEIIILSSVE